MNPSGPPAPSVGPIAVRLGLITADQLEGARLLQAQDPQKSLDDILIELNLLTADQVESIQRESNRFAAPPRRPGPRGQAKPASARPTPGRPKAARSGDSRKMWTLVGAIGGVTIAAIVGFLVLKPKPEAPVDNTSKAPPKAAEPAKPKETPKEAPVKPKAPEAAKVENLRIRAELKKLTGSSDIVNRWNSAVDRINSMRDPEQYKPVLDDLGDLVKDSAGTPWSEDIRDGYRDVIDAVKKRGEQVFGFLADEVERLTAGGKHGAALKSWDWFPGNLDLAGLYATRIEGIKKKTLESGRAFYRQLTDSADRLVKEGKFQDAQLSLFKALEIEFPEFSNDAYKRINDVTILLEAALNREAEEELARFAKEEAERGEAAGAEARLQGQFFELVSRRRLDAARDLLGRQSTPGAQKAAEGLKATLADIAAGFELAGESLKKQAGRQVTLAFLENGAARTRSFQLKSVKDGKIIYLLEGKELTAPLTDLHSQELTRLSAGLSEPDRVHVTGLAQFLAGEFEQAHTILTGGAARAKGLLAFVEGSSDFLAKNAPVLKERAARFIASREWEQAIGVLTRLASIPAERKEALRSRARAYFQLNNFSAVLLDIRTLFQLDDVTPENIDLLNQSYNRSAHIKLAAETYETAAERLPRNASVAANLYWLYMRTHQFDKARAAVKRALEGGALRASEADSLITRSELIEKCGMPGTTHRSQFGRYDVITDTSPEYANRMATLMDEVYRAYSKYFPYKKNETLRFRVLVFQQESDFLKFNSSLSGIAFPPGTRLGAFYSPNEKQLVGFDMKDWEEMQSTFRHEGLHQFIDYFVDGCPAWFNEGYASFFETSTVDEIKFNPERHHSAKMWIRDSKNSFKELFHMNLRDFQAKGAIQYGPSWAAIYYLIVNGKKSVLDAYLEALMEGKDGSQAFDTVFGPGKLNFEEFEANLRRAIFNDDYKQTE
jgi:hypothetical protein